MIGEIVKTFGGKKYKICLLPLVVDDKKFRYQGKWWNKRHFSFTLLSPDLSINPRLHWIDDNKNIVVAVPIDQ